MYLARITLTAPADASGPGLTAALAVDLIWAVTSPHDRVEHVSARAAPGRIEIGLFTSSADPGTAAGLARRACERSAPLAGWTWTATGG